MLDPMNKDQPLHISVQPCTRSYLCSKRQHSSSFVSRIHVQVFNTSSQSESAALGSPARVFTRGIVTSSTPRRTRTQHNHSTDNAPAMASFSQHHYHDDGSSKSRVRFTDNWLNNTSVCLHRCVCMHMYITCIHMYIYILHAACVRMCEFYP